MAELNETFGKRYRLLTEVIHDDLERFHFPGEIVTFSCDENGRVRYSAGHDTLELGPNDIEPL